MTRNWCLMVHPRGFFFRLNGYGLRLVCGGKPLYRERKIKRLQPWRVIWLGPVHWLLLLPSDELNTRNAGWPTEAQAPCRRRFDDHDTMLSHANDCPDCVQLCTVCSACLSWSCWNGFITCDEARRAGPILLDPDTYLVGKP